jgi:hypothetical protein
MQMQIHKGRSLIQNLMQILKGRSLIENLLQIRLPEGWKGPP